jgi:hypothetical protein
VDAAASTGGRPGLTPSHAARDVQGRFAQARGRSSAAVRYRRLQMRVAVVLAVAVPLATADLVLKGMRPTPTWAWHERSYAWLLLCVVVLACLLGLLRVPSLLVPPAAGILAGGVLGNALSAAWNDLAVPNPIVVTEGRAVIAFNLADVWVMSGLLALFSVVAVWLVQNRESLPAPRRLRR